LIISFDIDNTLIPYSEEFSVEKVGPLWNLLKPEKLRKGCKELFLDLQARDHKIWIYTTSFRSVLSLRKTFAAHGLYPEKFINQTINQKKLNAAKCKASKNPKLFGIDLHIDDSPGVGIEGERLHFEVLIVDPFDVDWTEKVLAHVVEM